MKGYIHLENGETFEGKLHAVSGEEVYGEAVFFTGMTGYQEVMTDPSFYGQIVVFTYPLIGNYGYNNVDNESKDPQPSAIIMSSCEEEGYHYESRCSALQAAADAGIPVLTGVDTRALVKRIREHGDMGAIVSSSSDIPNFTKYDPIGTKMLINHVCVEKPETFGDGDQHVVLIDFGYKGSMVDSLIDTGCKVTVVPFDYPEEKIHELQPDGLLFSNGPGNPKQVENYLPQYRRLAETYPSLGICLGHQLIALAFGGDTKKLTFGHRGANQPVQDNNSKRVFMTSQNHSYVVDDNSLPKGEFKIRYKNINDGSVEGLSHLSLPVTTVQFHPEAHPGPADSHHIFNEFIEQLKNKGREEVYV